MASYLSPGRYGTPLLHDSIDSTTELNQSPRPGQSSPRHQTAGAALGTPGKKQLVPTTHVVAASISLLCLLFGILTITPSLRIAWSLQFSGQIVVIGFLLGIMNLCERTILPYTFLLLETRFGRSRLQNYEAILTGKVFLSHTSAHWRLALAFMLALPLGLSVAYKRFLGGKSSANITPDFPILYGIDFPRVGSWSPPNDPVYLLITSVSAFLSASQFQTPLPAYPSPDEFPVAYGYNTLLLSNNSAAVLDIPIGPYLSTAQSQMSRGEVWNVEAPVDAYLAVRDTTSDFKTNDNTWTKAFASSLNSGGGVSTIDLYNDKARLGMMPAATLNNEFYYGIYYNRQHFGGIVNYNAINDSDVKQFRNTAHKFNIARTRCRGQWQVNSTTILLTSGNCDITQPINSSVLQAPNSGPIDFDVLPSAYHMVDNLTGPPNAQGQPEATWLDANYAIATATIYWARALFEIYRAGQNNSVLYYGGPYPPANQTIVSERGTLHASPLLYLVLSVQPTIMIIALFVTIWLHSVPLGKGFGIVSILSGFEPSKSQSVAGAGLSGKLKSPISLAVSATASDEHSSSPDAGPIQRTRLTYRLTSLANSAEKTKLQKGRTYW